MFIIYDSDILEEWVKEEKLKASQIWNCDKSAFPNNPQKSEIVGVKGKTAGEVMCGAGRKNITTLAVCNVAFNCVSW